MREITSKTKAQIERIISLLKEHGQMHIRGISRVSEIHPMTVSRLIDSYLSPFLEINEINEFGLKVKLVKLRDGRENLIMQDVLKYIEIKKRIRNNSSL